MCLTHDKHSTGCTYSNKDSAGSIEVVDPTLRQQEFIIVRNFSPLWVIKPYGFTVIPNVRRTSERFFLMLFPVIENRAAQLSTSIRLH